MPREAASIETLLARAARDDPERTALVLGTHALTYRDVYVAAEGLATRLAPVVEAGDRVAVVAPNVPALVVGMFAAWRAGAVAVPLSARLREYDLRRIFENAEPAVALSVSAYRGHSFAELLPRLAAEAGTVRRTMIVDELGEVTDELSHPPARDPSREIDADVGVVLYTSGTTGESKGALVRHTRGLRTASVLHGALELRPEDRCLQVIPIAHAFGLECMLTAVAAAGSVVLADSSFSFAPVVDAIRRGHATILNGSPTLWISALKAFPEGLPAVRAGLVGGARTPPEVLERLDELGTRVLNVYGMTEIGAAACCRLDDPAEARYETAGHPLEGFEWRVDVRDTDVPPSGELYVRGPAVTPGYLGRPAETADALVEGWFRTGDLGWFDEDGRLHISGRLKDVVHIAGFSVFPAEIEGFLLTHPDVREAIVVGAPHETMGEVLQAFVVAEPKSDLTPSALLRYARPRIADYKIPYGVRIVDELPHLPSGKPDRLALGRLASEVRMGRTEARG